uniref:Uncharacterized protein SAML0227 n=1 Tax=Streptomyces ambofaciens (strain ATCC 23877 / 3486 / DSM 40053 / JCM 4204 / NBRC 12836 / NRRL B-2516) TaxID=278992 RepID=Q1RRD2_STRA7|nr:unknown hypothetical protein [Streptomyces ambofaciens ATCC 23877]
MFASAAVGEAAGMTRSTQPLRMAGMENHQIGNWKIIRSHHSTLACSALQGGVEGSGLGVCVDDEDLHVVLR